MSTPVNTLAFNYRMTPRDDRPPKHGFAACANCLSRFIQFPQPNSTQRRVCDSEAPTATRWVRIALALAYKRTGRLIFAIVSACGLNFRSLPQLDLSFLPALWALQYHRVV